jgi:hypothetical protein
MNPPRVFCDADVIFAGAASPQTHGASLLVLRISELGLIPCSTSQQAIDEAERNIARKLPDRLSDLRALVDRSLTIVSNPLPHEIERHRGMADPKDLPILVAAIQHAATRLLTFNVRHFHPPSDMIIIQRPGDFLREVRTAISALGRGADASES